MNKTKDELKFVVCFDCPDGKERHTMTMSKMGAELALCLIPFPARVIPASEVVDPDNAQVSKFE